MQQAAPPPFFPPSQFMTIRTFAWIMTDIWGADVHGLYDQWHRAQDVAKATGGRRTGGGQLNGQRAETWRWPNGQGVTIASSGAAWVRASQFGNRGEG